MSIVVSTAEEIAGAQTNNSQAKQLFSFGKADRFPKPPMSACGVFVYDLPTVQEQRAAGFGYGRKYDFTKERGRGIPAPNTYLSPTDFDRKHPSSPSFSFGVSREQVSKRFIENHPKPDPSVPGPGTYNPLKPLGTDQLKYTIRPRTSAQSLFSGNSNPGPGTYAPKTGMSSKGEYFLSKYKNSGACSFSPTSSVRFMKPNRAVISMPGPDRYRPKVGMSDNGEYFVSRFKSSMCRTFSHSSRISQPEEISKRLDTPGPGSYRIPSEFGYYVSKHALKKRPRTSSAPNSREAGQLRKSR